MYLSSTFVGQQSAEPWLRACGFGTLINAQRLGVRTSSYVSSLASASLASRTRVNKVTTSGLEPLTCSFRVCGQWLLDVAGVCNFGIYMGFSVPSFAHYCRALRAG